MASMVARDSSDQLFNMNSRNRRDSGELDVFEAARYFSGRPEGTTTGGFVGATDHPLPRRYTMEGKGRSMWVGGRKSLDMPIKDLLPSQSYNVDDQKHVKAGKKSKQPSSPGGRLASFLNSLFSQTSKKKSKSSSQSVKDEEESPGGRRKRRSSISHFRSTATAVDTKSLYSSSSSGFRTPPPYTPTKILYKDLVSNSDHKQVVPLSKCNGHDRSVTFCPQIKVSSDKRSEMNLAWIDERIKSIDGFSEKNKISGDGYLEEKIFNSAGLSEKSGSTVHRERRWRDEVSSLKNFRRAEDNMDDGADSDSSSDLFELQNYDLGVYSNGLPVYETTNVESIKRGAPIANISSI